jgi:hypothetical protein
MPQYTSGPPSIRGHGKLPRYFALLPAPVPPFPTCPPVLPDTWGMTGLALLP